ncbi:MAG: PAS domain S-box protein [Burkholderiaceae bacterium]|nr:PAS domain S-box protein [Burkholderiaceae bacterium]
MRARRPPPLRALLIGQFLLVVLAAVVVVGVLVGAWHLPNVQARGEAEQHRATAMALQQLETSLDTAEQLASSLASLRTGTGTDAGERGGALPSAVLGRLLTELVRQGEVYEGLYLLDSAHRIVEFGLTEHTPNRSAWRGHDLSGLPVLQLADATRLPQWSDQYQSPTSARPVVGLALPLERERLLVELSAAQLAQSVARPAAASGLLVLVLDGNGELLASSVTAPSQVRVNLSHLPTIQAALRGGGGFAPLVFDGEAYAGTARRSHRLGWVVYVGYPQALAQASRQAAIGITVVTLLVALVVGVLTLSLLARQIQRRVDRTVDYARAVAAGHYEELTRASGIRELEVLDNSLSRMAQAIQQRQQQLGAIVDNTPNLAIQWFDRSGRVLNWNPAAEALLGWSKAEALGRTLGELIYTPDQQQAFMDVLADIERTGQPFGPYEGEVRHRDGSVRVLLSTTYAIPDLTGGQQFVCTDIDITSLKDNEARIRASEEKFNLFFNASPVAVAVMEHIGGKYLYLDVNRAWEALMGHDRSAVVGRGISSTGIVADAGAHAELMAKLEREDIVPWVETMAVRADGSHFLAEGAMGRVHMQGKELVIYSIHDITDKRRMEQDLRAFNAELEDRIQRRTESLTQANEALQQAVDRLQQAQAQLVQSEKLASLGEMVAGVAHELNTPIGNGLMAVSTLSARAKGFRAQSAQGLRRSDLEQFMAQVETAGDIATRNLQRASDLISSFKQVAVDQTSSQRRVFDLANLCHEIVLTLQPMLKRTPYQVVCEVEAGVQLDSYPGPLGQVLTNLIQNAVTHGLDGQPQGTVWLRGHAQGSDWVLSVEDDGRGIAPDALARVFDPFYTTRLGQGGSGLGLHLAHHVVSGVLGGRVEASNRPEGGACFRLHCPLQAPRLAANPPQARPQTAAEGVPGTGKG